MTINAAGNRSTTADHGGDRRSTVAVNDGRRRRPPVNGSGQRRLRWRTTVDCRWTTVDHHRTTGQRTMLTCHVPIRPAATCTVPRTQLLAAATWQHPIGKPPVTWHLRQHRSTPVNATGGRSTTAVHRGDRRSTTVNAAGHRSTPADHGGDRRSTVAVNDGRRWRTTVDCRWTTIDHHQTTGQWWLVGWSTIGSGPVWIGSGSGRVWAGSGSGLDRVWVGSATWHATC
nr:hypothetical protein [Tanacetum cinerariifolium]